MWCGVEWYSIPTLIYYDLRCREMAALYETSKLPVVSVIITYRNEVWSVPLHLLSLRTVMRSGQCRCICYHCVP